MLAGDQVLNVPVTNAAEIRSAANRLLDQHRLPVELMDLPLVLGVEGVPRLVPGDAVKVVLALQQDLDVHLPNAADLWLVHAQELTQPGVAQAAVRLHLSRRLPDYRTRDFWSRADMPGTGGRQIVIGGGAGAPQIAQVIPAQRVVVGRAAVTLDLGDYFSDPDGDMLTYAAVSSDTAAATVSVAGDVLTITPVAVGSATVTVTASDATRSAAQQVVVTVAANRSPALVNSLPDRALGASAKTYALPPFFSDPDGDELTYSVVSSDTAVVTAAITGTDTLRLTPQVDDMSADITVTVSDGLLSISETFSADVDNRRPLPQIHPNIQTDWLLEPGDAGWSSPLICGDTSTIPTVTRSPTRPSRAHRRASEKPSTATS